ncbi:MAG: CoA transferase [Gammaproteobacteria bacterium]|nr:CoA transferase [Gammaproteobacteria bacterium]
MPGPASELVLDGMRIVDFSRLLPGPWCAQILGDLGADVIKVEALGTGDPSRHNPPDFTHSSVYFHAVNANKRGLGLDIRTPDGQRIIRSLLERADCIIESFRPEVAARLNIDYETVRAYNPKVVYASFSGYGQTGPLAGVPGHDLIIQAMSGHMGAGRGGHSGVPTFQAADYAGASMGAIGLLAALMKQRISGVGSYLDISLFYSLVYMSKIAHTESLAKLAGNDATARMEVYGDNPRYSTYETADGKAVAVSFLEARVWAQFCRYIEREDLIDPNEGPDARHSTHGERAAQYRQTIASYCAARSRDQLVKELEAQQIPVCPILEPSEALEGSQARARGVVKYVDHPDEGRIPLLANPLRHSGLVHEDRVNSPSEVGQDSADILASLGIDAVEYAALRDRGVVA